jgi:hypothetical protein
VNGIAGRSQSQFRRWLKGGLAAQICMMLSG